MPGITFEVTENGELRWPSDASSPSASERFQRSSILDRVLEMLHPVQSLVTYDLNKRSVRPPIPQASEASFAFYLSGARAFRESDLSAVMMMSKQEVICDDLELLRQLNTQLLSARYIRYHRPHTFILKFENLEGLTLEEVRLDATALMDMTIEYPGQTTIRLEIISADEESTEQAYANIKLSDIRKSVFEYMSKIRDGFSDAPGIETTEVWIDGSNRVQEAISSPGTSIANMRLKEAPYEDHESIRNVGLILEKSMKGDVQPWRSHRLQA